MRVPADRLASLGSPPFIAALALLVLNDFALKPAFHNAVTGKLSDFAGLFALTLFAAILWPRHRAPAGIVIAGAFTFWKTSAAEPLIEWLDAGLPFAVGRTVDLTDLVALPMIPLASWAAPRQRPWALPRALQVALALVAPIAFTATSRVPYVARSTMDTSRVAAIDEIALQGFFDKIAEQRGLACDPCEPISGRRTYSARPSASGAVEVLSVTFDVSRRTLGYSAFAYQREGRRGLRALSADVRDGVHEQFPDIALIDLTTADLYLYRPAFSIFIVRAARGDEPVDRLSSILEELARTHALARGRSGAYHAGDRVGSPRRRELNLLPILDDGAALVIRIDRQGERLASLHRALAEDLAARLEAAFGAANVTRHVPADFGDF